MKSAASPSRDNATSTTKEATMEKLGIPRDEAKEREVIGALVDALYALRDLTEASESVAIYPEGSFGLEDLAEAEKKARAVLDRFDLEGTDE